MVLQIVIQMIYTAIIARMIPQESFALMGVVLSIMGFAEIFSQVGIGPALIQRKELQPQHLTGAFYTSLILGVIFTLAFVASAPLFAKAYQLPELEPIMQVVCTSFTISALAVVPRSLMMKEMKFKNFFIAGMISIVGGNLIVGLLLAYAGFEVWAYVWALFAQNLLMTLSYWMLQPTRFPLKWKWQQTRELIGYGGASTLFNSLNYAATKVDVMLLPKYVDALPASEGRTKLDTAGVYERSAYVMSLPITIMAKLSDNVLFSGMSKMQDELERLRRLILIGTQMIGIIIIPTSVFISIFAEELVTIYLGPSYVDAGAVLQVLFIAIVFRTLTRLSDALLRAKNAVMKGSYYKAFYLLLMIVGVYVAIPYGLTAIAWSIVATTFIHYLMSIHLCHLLISSNYWIQLKALLPGLLLGIITIISASPFILFESLISLSPLVKILAAAVIWGVSLLAAITIAPSILKVNGISPLELLPQRMKQLPFINRLFK